MVDLCILTTGSALLLGLPHTYWSLHSNLYCKKQEKQEDPKGTPRHLLHNSHATCHTARSPSCQQNYWTSLMAQQAISTGVLLYRRGIEEHCVMMSPDPEFQPD